MKSKFTAILRPEADMFFAVCAELDVASQGKTQETALDNLREAVTLFLETASKEEIKTRLSRETVITLFEVENAPCKAEEILRREGFREVTPTSRAFPATLFELRRTGTREDR